MANLQQLPQLANGSRFAQVQSYLHFARLRLVARRSGNVDAVQHYDQKMQTLPKLVA